VLYLWEVLEGNGLLVSSMQRLNELAAAANGADGIPSVVGAVNWGTTAVSRLLTVAIPKK